jgi:hypothetical protein
MQGLRELQKAISNCILFVVFVSFVVKEPHSKSRFNIQYTVTLNLDL